MPMVLSVLLAYSHHSVLLHHRDVCL
ncbi:rCG42016 [Rattus norvegicus]|uniref:RCG42016 n=1 Tax=Rattus norvegicus TaxID=10116 RepID=A6JV06_RAT|nr:rCG42016 [Rattus norvegicus]